MTEHAVDAAADGGEPGLIELDRRTCLDLLAGVDVGRVAWPDGDRVMVFPLNFALDGDEVVVRTRSSELLAAAATHRVLTFQGDEFEPGVRSGWTVLLSGPAEEVTEPADVTRLQGIVAPWRDDGPFRILRIRSERITGRRLRLHPGSIGSVYVDESPDWR